MAKQPFNTTKKLNRHRKRKRRIQKLIEREKQTRIYRHG